MKKKYTRKQITEAIAYWKTQLRKIDESTIDENDIGVTYRFLNNFKFDMLDATEQQQFKDLMTNIDRHEQTMNDFTMDVPDRNVDVEEYDEYQSVALAVDQDGNIVGVCVGDNGLSFIPHCVDLSYCVVDDAFRGKNLGNELVDFFCNETRKVDPEANITLCVNVKNPRAAHVYEKNGFKPFMMMMLNQK